MIIIDRSAVPEPKLLRSERIRMERRRMQEFFAIPQQQRAQQRYEFETALLWAPGSEIRTSLTRLFHDKCAYCETPLVDQRPNLEHFRPKVNARDPFRGTVDPDHYWWLYYEWQNLYVICQECNVTKRDQFPVLGKRARINTQPSREQALLLNPCLDDPAEFLDFLENGRVVHTPAAPARGEATIHVLGLNRDSLVSARAKAASETSRLMLAEEYTEVEKRLLAPSNTYLAVRHAVIRRLAIQLGDRVPASLLRKVAVRTHTSPDGSHSRRGATDPTPPNAPVSIQTTYVIRVEIQNFRAIRELALEFHPQGTAVRTPPPPETTASTDRVGWKVLLGENGSGKSSVVQAICIALAGPEHAKRWLKGRELLRRPGDGEPPPRRGSVKLHLSRGEAITFEIRGSRVRFTSGAEGAGTFLRAYGATRLLPGPRKRKVPVPQVVQIENLFNPFVPLHHADRWLAGLPQDRFHIAARTLKDLLRMDSSRNLVRNPNGAVLVPDEAGVLVPLHNLSDGYQTVIALAVDIMAGLPEQEMDYRSSPGIVLLDELGTHLHPRWRMVIVESLRNAFSSMQFIATTHEPLCLRGLREGEIAVMRRDGDEVGVMTDLPSPERLRIDQLLTSPFFGLHTTIDPEVDRRFQEYYDLLATPSLPPELAERREQLREELARFGVLGYTRRDQLMYDVVDRYLAKAQQKGTLLSTLPLSAKKEIIGIWRRVGALREARR